MIRATAASLLACCLWACGPSGTARIDGVDVSRHQGPLDWVALRKAGARFAYIKATEGADWADPAYRAHESAARAAGVVVGAYHFFTFCSDPEKQAAWFLTRLHLRPGDLPPAVDVESAGNCAAGADADKLPGDLAAFNRRVAAAIGVRPLLYTTQAFHLRYLRGTEGLSPLWIRNTSTRPLAVGKWAIWQHRVAPMPGAEGPIDQNAFMGGEAAFAAFRYPGQSGATAAMGLSAP